MSETASSTEVHPLFNPIILGKIFSFLPIHSLKSSRLGCKTWSKAALPFLQKSSKVVLIRGGKADHDHFSFRNFMDLISSFSKEDPAPFENYYLDHWALNEKREKSLKQFWDICGPSMKSLHLSNVIFYELETIRNILYYWSPNLNSLTLEDCLFYTITSENELSNMQDALKPEDFDEPNISYDYYDHVTVEQLKNIDRCRDISCINNHLTEFSYDQLESEEFPISWEEILHAFPNIQRLNIACTTQGEQVSKILDAIHTVREESNSLGSITGLNFYQNAKPAGTAMNICDAHLYKISDIICLPLTSLAFVISDSMQLDSIANLVRQYSPVLKNLCIHSEKEADSHMELFKFQRFPCLLKLCVSKDILGENFNFIEIMPKLKQLHLWLTEEEFNWETSITDVIQKSAALKTFSSKELYEVSFGYTFTSPQAASLLCSWFKNLRVLMMALTDEIIRVVFKELKNLEEITVFDRHLSDVGITGNPRWLTDNSTWHVESQREFPYIGDLKKLWKFTLTFRRYENITDSSVYQGFMDVPSLSSLLLTRTKIGDKALRDLSMKSSLITMVTPTVCKGIDVEYAD